MRRVVITGQGTINPLGKSVTETSAAFADGRCGIGELDIRDVDRLTVKVGGQVRNFEPDSHFDRQELALYDRFTQASEVRMYSSSDGIVWFQVPGGAVISPGAIGAWDSEFIAAGRDLVPFGSDRIAVPYHGTPFPHKYPRWDNVLGSHRVGWVWWQKGRLSAVVADEEGEFFTFATVPAGRSIRLNARTRGGGEVRVGVIRSGQANDSGFHIRELYSQREEVAGRSVSDCDAFTGDSLSAPVYWGGNSDIGSADGEQVTLHFKLRSAELFGFEWV